MLITVPKLINEEFQKKLQQWLAARQASQGGDDSVDSNYTPTKEEMDDIYLEVYYWFSSNIFSAAQL